MTHTPGPWHIGKSCYIDDDFEGVILEAGDFLEKGDERETVVGAIAGDNEEAQANARLIAQAPAMAESLRTLLEAADRPYYTDLEGDENTGLSKAISKARAILRAIEEG